MKKEDLKKLEVIADALIHQANINTESGSYSIYESELEEYLKLFNMDLPLQKAFEELANIIEEDETVSSVDYEDDLIELSLYLNYCNVEDGEF